MGYFGRLKRGFTLTVDSVKVLIHYPKLMLFPLLGGISAIGFLAVFLGSVFGFSEPLAGEPGNVEYAILFGVYLITTFITVIFTAGLVHETRKVYRGNAPSIQRGLGAAWDVKVQLFVWALISATIGVLINMIENSDSRIARIFAAIFSVAWTVLTFFIVPVVVFEKESTVGMFKRSGETFKSTWGETGVSLFATSLVGILVFLLFGGSIIGVGVFIESVEVVIAGFVIGVVVFYLVSSTTKGIIRTTLYMYAAGGTTPHEFDNIDINSINAK